MKRKTHDRPRVPAKPLVVLPTQRGMSEKQAAAYVGISVVTFRDEVARGIWPAPRRVGRKQTKKVYDKRAIDLAYDLLSGIVTGKEYEAAALAALDKWRGLERPKKRPRS